MQNRRVELPLPSSQSQSAVSINTQRGSLDKHRRNLFTILHNLVTEELKYPLAYFLCFITLCICVSIRLSFHVLSGVCSPACRGHSEVAVTHEEIICPVSDQGHTKGPERLTPSPCAGSGQTKPCPYILMRWLFWFSIFFTDLCSALRFLDLKKPTFYSAVV